MNSKQHIAKHLRQMVVVLWIVGACATVGYAVVIINQMTIQDSNGFSAGHPIVPIIWMVSIWITLGWMGLLAHGLAELLAPTES